MSETFSTHIIRNHYLYNSPLADHNNLVIEKIEHSKMSIIRAETENGLFPLMKCNNTKLSFLFANPKTRIERSANVLGWNDTQAIIRYELNDSPERRWFKPTCTVNYKFQVIPNDDWTEITLRWNVFYSLYHKEYVTVEATSKDQFTYKRILTTPRDFDFTLTPKEYMDALAILNMEDCCLAANLLKKAYPSEDFSHLTEYEADVVV